MMEAEVYDVSLNAKKPGDKNLRAIPEIDMNDVDYDTFFKTFILCNTPCKIRGLCQNWNSFKTWVVEGRPNFKLLEEKYKNCNVTVYNCNEKYFDSQETERYEFSDYLKDWKDYIYSGYSQELPLLYLKDWHLQRNFPDDKFYEVPLYFVSDWLNEYLEYCNTDDYKFVYMGPKGSWTPLHTDVFTSYSWSSNICGTKKWIFFPPEEHENLKDVGGNLLYDVSHCESNKNCFVVIQNAGETVFVPTGWYHQVWNLEDTISINHNWVNGCNIETMWHSLEDKLVNVKHELADCVEMENFLEQCQIVLNALFGMDFKEFYNFLEYIASRRIKLLNEDCAIILFKYAKLGKNHAVFDLQSLVKTLRLFVKHDDLKTLNHFQNIDINLLIDKIGLALKNVK